jgi:hypothetical protein
MSQGSSSTGSHSNYRAIFDNALEVYRKKTGEDISSHPLLAKLESCRSPDAVLTVLREQLPSNQPSSSKDQFTKWLNPTVKVLYSFSTVVGGSVSLVSPKSPIPISAL